MKNFINTVSHEGIILLLLVCSIFVGCKKGINTSEQQGEAAAPGGVSTPKAVKFKELGKQFLALGQDKDFRQFIYDECKVQKFGDYYVRIEDLLNNAHASKYFSPTVSSTITKLVTDLKSLGARSPILFYPSVETKENKKIIKKQVIIMQELLMLLYDHRF